MLAWTHLSDLRYQSSESPLATFAQASKNLKKALALDDEDLFAHVALSELYLLRKEHDKAIAAAERAIALCARELRSVGLREGCQTAYCSRNDTRSDDRGRHVPRDIACGDGRRIRRLITRAALCGAYKVQVGGGDAVGDADVVLGRSGRRG